MNSMCFVPEVYAATVCSGLPYSRAIMAGGNARGMQHVCTGHPGEQHRGMLPAHVAQVSRVVAHDRNMILARTVICRYTKMP